MGRSFEESGSEALGRIPAKFGAQRIQMADYTTGHPHDLHTSRQSD